MRIAIERTQIGTYRLSLKRDAFTESLCEYADEEAGLIIANFFASLVDSSGKINTVTDEDILIFNGRRAHAGGTIEIECHNAGLFSISIKTDIRLTKCKRVTSLAASVVLQKLVK